MIRKKSLYSVAILVSALQVCSVSPSLAMEYPAYDKSGNAVGKVGVKRRGQDVLEFTLTSNQTGKHVGFNNPTISLDLQSRNDGCGFETWTLDVDGQMRTASLDLRKKILRYRSCFYAPSQFHLGCYGYTPGTSIKMGFSDGNSVQSVAFPSIVLTRENIISKENKDANAILGSLLLEAICPPQMSKKALKKAKKEAQAERIASRDIAPLISDEERAKRRSQSTEARKALQNRRIRQQKKWR